MDTRAIAISSLALALCVLSSASALECGTPRPAGDSGAIKETPDQIAEVSTLVAGGGQEAEIPRVLEALRKRYPNGDSAELVNFLITAYCPSMDALSDLSDAQKTAKVRAFADRVLKAVY